jgi:ferredoxin
MSSMRLGIARWDGGSVPYVISEVCASEKNAGCVEVCPVDCIHPTPEEATFAEVDQLYIDPRECIDCGACVPQCPVDAISPHEDTPAGMEHAIAANAAYFS